MWNSTWNCGFERAFYLSYAPESAKKIAYAASIGKPALDDWEKPLMREALLRYDAISVREAEAAELLDSIGVPGACPSWIPRSCSAVPSGRPFPRLGARFPLAARVPA